MSGNWTVRSSEIKQKISEGKQTELILNNNIKTQSEEEAAKTKLKIVDLLMDLVGYNIVLTELSLAINGVKNDSYLNEARKQIYKILIILEELVSPFIDVPFKEYEDKLSVIEDFSDADRLKLLRKLGVTIDLLIDAFGDNSKWKWSLVEIEGRFAVVSKNMIDLKRFLAFNSPMEDGYEDRQYLMQIATKNLLSASDKYRQKYELSTQRIDDIRLAIQYLSSLRRLAINIGDSSSADDLKKKIDVWKIKMEDDLRAQEEKAKR